MSKNLGKERRRRPRAQVMLPVSVIAETRPNESVGTEFNLSETGAFLRTARAFEQGSAISVKFEDGVFEPAQLYGRVARVDGMQGVGVEFDGEHAGLRTLVRKLLATARDLHDRLDDSE